MTIATMYKPLTEGELDRLSDFLDGIEPAGMNVEMLDGYFAALICGPAMVLPSEYLPQVWGEDFEFDSEDQAGDILSLLMRHWNTIASELLHEPNVYFPVLLEYEDGTSPGNDWAQGFLRGVQTRPSSWSELLESEEQVASMLPFILLAHENDPDPALRPPPVKPDKRDELLQMMIASVTLIYRHFEPQRRSSSRSPPRRVGPKVGRNDPCPCGSGRKYKHCCAAGAPSVH